MHVQRLLVALDGSEAAAHAVDLTADLADALRAEVALVHVVDPKLAVRPEGGVPAATLLFELQRDGRQLLSTAVARLHTSPPPWQFLGEGKPADEIIKAAREWDAQLIVVGTHGRSGLQRVLMGSTAEAVVRHAPCPVLVARVGSK